MESSSNQIIKLVKNRPTERIFILGNVLLILSVILVVLTRTIADPDIWGHLRFGLDILETGEIAQIDPYSYLTEGQRWINHEWLAEVIFALTWIAGKSTGLLILNFGVISITLILAFRHLFLVGIRPLRITVLLFIAVILLSPFLPTIRPQMFTYLFFVITILIINRAEHGSYKLLWFAPLILALWVNLHGGFLAGLATLGSWGILHIVFSRNSWKQILPPILASAAATCINPYGFDLLSFLFQTATIPRPEIVDWQPLSLSSFLGLTYLTSLMISILGVVFSRRERSVVLVILFCILSVMPLVAIRHLQLFSIASFIITGEHIWDAWDRIRPQKPAKKQISVLMVNLPIILSIILILLSAFRGITIKVNNSSYRYPVANVSFLKEVGVKGHLATEFIWGEYVIWHLGPEVKVSIDGRRETVYPNDVYKKYLNFHVGRDDWDALLSDYETDMALVEKSSTTYNLLILTMDWSLIREDEVSALFAPKESPLTAILQRATPMFETPLESNDFP
jgi:hypothetical protein